MQILPSDLQDQQLEVGPSYLFYKNKHPVQENGGPPEVPKAPWGEKTQVGRRGRPDHTQWAVSAGQRIGRGADAPVIPACASHT